MVLDTFEYPPFILNLTRHRGHAGGAGCAGAAAGGPRRVDAVNVNGKGALVLANRDSHPSVAALLVAAGAGPVGAALGGRTALHAAALAGADGEVGVLLGGGGACKRSRLGRQASGLAIALADGRDGGADGGRLWRGWCYGALDATRSTAAAAAASTRSRLVR